MNCNCRDHMHLIERREVHEWKDDMYDMTIFEDWQCGNCGNVEEVDNTDSICENPY